VVEPPPVVRLERTPEGGCDEGVDTLEVHRTLRHAFQHADRRPGPEGLAPRGGERQHGGPRPPVTRRGGGRAVDHLRIEVARGARDHPGLGEARVVGHLGDPEVDHHGPRRTQHDVPGFEVPVDDAHPVDRGEGVRQPVGEARELGDGEGTVRGDVVLQRGSVHQLRHDEGVVVVDLRVEDTGDALAADAVEEVDLAAEACARGRVLGDVGVQDLERHGLAVIRACLPDGAHAAGSDAADQPVAAELLHDTRIAQPQARPAAAPRHSRTRYRGHFLGRTLPRPWPSVEQSREPGLPVVSE